MTVALILLVTLSPVAPAAENIVLNPGFEDLTDAGDWPAQWPRQEPPGARFAWDDAVAHSGDRSARVDGMDPELMSPYVQAWRQDVGPLPDGQLWFSVWVKAENVTTGRLNILHKAADGEVLLNQGVSGFDGTFGWREIAGPLETVQGAVSLQLVMGLVKSTGSAWFDDVSVSAMGDLGDVVGRLGMLPSEPQPAGATVPAHFEVALGDAGLANGGAISLRWENWRPAREFKLSEIVATCDALDAKLEVTIPPRKKSWPPTPKPIACVATLTEGGPLPAETVVTIDAALTYTRKSNVACDLTGLLSRVAEAAMRPLEGRHSVSAVGGPAAQLVCIAEARPVPGATSRVTVAATDEFGNPAGGFRGSVKLSADTKVKLPKAYAFTEDDGGSHRFDVEFPAGKVTRLRAKSGKMKTNCNPVLPRDAGEPGIYFGDIHVHCEISGDGVGDPEMAYDHAKRFVGLDFAALSDHSPRGDRWTRTVEIGNRWNEPGIFPTILGFEWSDTVKGHRNAYYRGDAGPEQPAGMKHNMETWWEFFDAEGIRALTIPHHPNTQSAALRPDGKPVWGPVDWSVVDPKYQRVVELNQNRGSFEAPGGPLPELRIMREDCGSSVQAALAKGHRLGFIGSTDAHSGRPGDGPARCAIAS
ncbi:MAG TPA: DUF3604 domain-containing protein, partial [Armatimonadota bacterium]|nr:DUF3604 domain-containing protein [Armatimonadota bacterium]